VQRNERRYYSLAKRGQVGTRWREVPVREYWIIQKAMQPYGSLQRLTAEELQHIVRQLKDLRTHVYEITRVERNERQVSIDLGFVREDVGL
jgi:hypothetical protein